MTSYYKTISTALEESAYIDGATFLQTFWHIILPLAKPGLVTIALLQFINTWNEFYFALMLTSGDTARTVPIALNYYMATFANNYSALFAAVVMDRSSNHCAVHCASASGNEKPDSWCGKGLTEGQKGKEICKDQFIP